MNLVSLRNLTISILLGLLGFFLVYNEVFFVLPGTNLLTDLREIFVTISAALFGPVGGALTGIITCLYDPNSEILVYIIVQHIVSAVLLSIYYKKFVYEKLKMPYLIAGWVFGIFLYYYVFYLPVFITTFFVNPEFFNNLVPDQHGTFGLKDTIELFKGWFPEFVFTSIFTSLILIALPENFRKPRWGKALSLKPFKIIGSASLEKLHFKNSLAVRLLIWFLLLAIFPILLIGISVKKDFTNSLLLNEANTRESIISEIKRNLPNIKPYEANEFISRVNQNVKGEIFIIDNNGSYIFISDTTKIGTLAAKDFPKRIIETILTRKNGKLIDFNSESSFAYLSIEYQSKRLIIVSISDPAKVTSMLENLTQELHKKLFIGLAIISIGLIGIIHLLIKAPLTNIRRTIESISAGKYDIRVDTNILTDEIKNLGFALNTMANKIIASEKKFREMAELLPQTLFECDLTGKLTYANQNGYALFGYTREDIERGINVLGFIHPDDRLKAGLNIKKIFNREIVKGNEYRGIKKDGSSFSSIIYTTYFEENGKVSGLRGILVDISNLRLAEESVKASEEKFSSIIQGLRDMIFIADVKGRMSFISPSSLEILGYSENELLGKSAFDFIHPDDVPKMTGEFKKVIKLINTGKPTLFRTRQKSGNYIYLESIGVNLLSNKFVKGVVIIARDVTERIKYENKLQESEAKLRESQRVAKLGHYDFDIQSGLWNASQALDELFGIDGNYPHDYQGWIGLVFPDDRTNIIQYFSEYVIKSKNSFKKEYRIVRQSDKKVLWVYGLGNLELDLNDNPVKMFGTIQDITDRKIAQNVLFNSEQRFKYIWENALDAMRITDERGKVLFVNNAYCNLVNKKREELEGYNFTVVFPEEDRENARIKYLENFRLKSSAGRKEYRLKFWNNKVIYSDSAMVYLKIPEQPVLLFTVQHNITDRKIAEDYLKESEEKFRHAFDYSAAGITILGRDGKFQKANNAFLNMVKYSENEIKKLTFKDITHPDDIRQSNFIRDQLLDDKIKNLSFEKRYITKENKVIWGYISISLVRDANNKPQFFISQVVDVTERKMAELEVRKLSRAVEQSPAIILITDTKGSIEYVNPKFTEITGYTFDEVRGVNPKILKSGHTSDEQYKTLWKTINSGREWRGEFLNKKKNGEVYWEHAFISPIINEEGKILNYLAVKEDITERKKLLSDLIEAKQKAEEMNKIKSYFFANMSHELRTPFVGILGYSELLSESLQNPEEKEMAHQILRSSKRLTDTLNKILNVTRIEFDNLEIKTQNFDICKLISGIIVLYSTSAQLKSTTINAICSAQSIIVNTDPKILEDVLNNLVSNAIKFTENGSITLSIDVSTESDSKHLIIKVKDTGIGIPKEKQDIVWHEFRQASEGFSRSFEGTGLGLTISKKYIKTLGGEIYLESEEGIGTTFTITIPINKVENETELILEKSTESKSQIKVHRSKNKPKILYVEDDLVSLQYVNIVLKSEGQIDTAVNAALAIEFAEKNIYDILMLDINLGKGMDGVELMQKIRQRSEYKNKPFIAVTAYASETDKKEFLAKGFTHYISKPFSSNELKKLLNEIIV